MRNPYTDRLDQEIAKWSEKREALIKDPEAFTTKKDFKEDVITAYKLKDRQLFSIDYINGQIAGLIEAKSLYYKTVKITK